MKFITCGDSDIEIVFLQEKLALIQKYFPFNSVDGIYDTELLIDLNFDNGIELKGEFNHEPFNINMVIGDTVYELNIHPYDSMGGFNETDFEESLKNIYKLENSVSLVICHEGYAVKSFMINKLVLDDYQFIVVKGDQLEGKLLANN